MENDPVQDDAPLFDTSVLNAPAPDAPAAPDPNSPLSTPEVQLAIERAKTEAYERALASRVEATPTTHREDDTPAYQPQRSMQPPPPTWQDLMNAQQRKEYEEALLVNPSGAAAWAAQLSAYHSRLVLEYQAAPILQANGQAIVENFKHRMRTRDRELADHIEPLFDKELAKTPDFRTLVTNPNAHQELQLRWDSAKSAVQDKMLRAARKPEPKLLANGSNPSAGPAPTAGIADRDPVIAALSKKYAFTPEQLKELESIS